MMDVINNHVKVTKTNCSMPSRSRFDVRFFPSPLCVRARVYVC